MNIKLIQREAMSVEANVQRVPNGDLILLCTCGGLVEPAIENRTVIFRSKDNGKTWTKKEQLNVENGLAHYHTDTAVYPDGRVRVYISEHNGAFVGWHNYYLESADSGATWEKHDLTALPEYAFVRSYTKLSNGDILHPFHYYPVTQEIEKESYAENRPIYKNELPYIESGYLLSHDGGKTFDRHSCFKSDIEWIKKNSGIIWIWPENTIVETEAGHLVMYFRVDVSHYLWRSDSYDMGKTWSEPIKTEIPNPANKPQLLKWGKKIVLLNTPNTGRGIESRNPLEIWISKDGTKSWYKKIKLSEFPGGYSYANGFIEGDVLYLAFEFNRHDIYFATVNLKKDK